MSDTRRYASPVSKDGFFYSGDASGIYVRIDQHTHHRSPSGHLNALLHPIELQPVYTKKGTLAKRQPQRQQDPPWHFYSAQLLHYGLRPSKTKATAKKRLIDAFHGQTLLLPEHIIEIERELTKRWEKENKVAEKRYKEEKKAREERETAKRVAAIQDARRVWDSYDDGGSGAEEGGEEDAEADGDIDDEGNSNNGEYSDDTFGTQRDEGSSDEEQRPKKRRKTNNKAIVIREVTYDPSGAYTVASPLLAEEWGDQFDASTFEVTLALSKNKDRLWGSYDFGMFSGVIRFSHLPAGPGDSVPCLWRGRENGEGEMSFGNDCKGTFTFAKKGRGFKGTMNLYGDVQFVGTWNDAISSSVEAQRFEAEWKEYNEKNYEAERVGRWR